MARCQEDHFLFKSFLVPPLTSTPAAKAKPNDVSTTTMVKLTINYPSKVVEKVLSEEYQAIGKALAEKIGKGGSQM